MNRILCICLLMALQSVNAARAYETDVHYSATYALARATGWTDAEALVIASANEGVDANEHTVAALEMETLVDAPLAAFRASSVRQAEKNLRFHCFSRHRSHSGELAADVVDVLSGHFAGVRDRARDARDRTRQLIALGVALHCQQDAHAHVDYGGACGSHAGSCYGHTHHNLLDHVVFRLVGRHYFNPDHPGVAGPRLLQTLEGTASALSRRAPRARWRPLERHELATLSDALRNSGLELPDDVRRECNRHIAGQWLAGFFRSRGMAQDLPEPTMSLGLDVARLCRSPSLAAAPVVGIPAPRFPQLNPDGSPWLVRADGTYELARGTPGVIPPSARAVLLPDVRSQRVRVQLSHWSQVLALTHRH